MQSRTSCVRCPAAKVSAKKLPINMLRASGAWNNRRRAGSERARQSRAKAELAGNALHAEPGRRIQALRIAWRAPGAARAAPKKANSSRLIAGELRTGSLTVPLMPCAAKRAALLGSSRPAPHAQSLRRNTCAQKARVGGAGTGSSGIAVVTGPIERAQQRRALQHEHLVESNARQQPRHRPWAIGQCVFQAWHYFMAPVGCWPVAK